MAKKIEFDLALVKKYIFWACVPIGIILPAVVIYLASSSVGQKIESRKKELTNQKDTVGRIASDRQHPNENTINEIKDGTEALRGTILAAWSILEKDQRKDNKWEGLSDRATREISGKKFLDELTGTTRNNYMEFARPKLEALVYMVDPRVPIIERRGNRQDPFGLSGLRRSSSEEKVENPEGTDAVAEEDYDDYGEERYGGSSRRGSNEQRMKGTVVWDKPEPLGLLNWTRQPKSFEVWFAQEDIWVYQALLSVVKESNKGATTPSSAVVKQIDSMLIGQLASPKLAEQSTSKINSTMMMGSMDDEDGRGRRGSPGGYSRDSGYGDEGGTGLVSDDLEMVKMATGRYVDAEGLPILDVQTALAAPFRRMPVYLSFIVDQQRIYEILANCANCAMPIDVVGVRVSTGSTRSGSGSRSGFDFKADNVNSGSGGGYSGRGDSGYSSRGGSRGVLGSSQESKSMLTLEDIEGKGLQGRGQGKDDQFGRGAIPIEIFGWINIYSPPDKDKLQVAPPATETADGDAIAGDAASPTANTGSAASNVPAAGIPPTDAPPTMPAESEEEPSTEETLPTEKPEPPAEQP
jgi:hypothetical protein